jgi:hypothetical protein
MAEDFERHKPLCNQRAATMLCRAVRRLAELGNGDGEEEGFVMDEIRRLARHKRVINARIEDYHPDWPDGPEGSAETTIATTLSSETGWCFRGWTALHECARLNNATVLDVLLQSGADVNVANSNRQTPVWLASSSLEVSAGILKRLLQQPGVDPNRAASDGSTPLVRATLVGSYRRVEMLLEAGARVNAGVDDSGRTVLQIAEANARHGFPLVRLSDSASGMEMLADEVQEKDKRGDGIDNEAKRILSLLQRHTS